MSTITPRIAFGRSPWLLRSLVLLLVAAGNLSAWHLRAEGEMFVPPGPFTKITPGNGETLGGTAQAFPVLSWTASSGATYYQYCLDSTDDLACNGVWGSNSSTPLALSLQPENLGDDQVYYWHVRAGNNSGVTYSNGGTAAFWSFRTGATPPATFHKLLPVSGATDVPTSPTLVWAASGGAVGYEYCIDAVINDLCNATWVPVGNALSVTVTGLNPSTQYSWQVRAVNGSRATQGDSVSPGETGPFLRFFTTGPPSPFGKSSPASGATGVASAPTLRWASSIGASNYDYCVDTTNDNACTNWVSAGNVLSAPVSGLVGATTYYWQVRATNASQTPTTANGGTHWSFATGTVLVATPSSLAFAATKNGSAGALTNVTPPQAVTVTFQGTPGSWTASSSQTWLQITNGSQAGPGQFSVAIVNPGNVIAGSTTLNGTITVSGVTVVTPTLISVTLTVDQTGSSTTASFGQVDTPAQNATNQVGAIGVTGWALDDVGVMTVKIYRTCLGFDNPASCQILLGRNVVFVGDATFLAGARPDVEAAFPTVPFRNRAGWGMQVLTTMLPNIPIAQAYGGQGTIDLFAVATDVEGHQTLLGRTTTDAVPTTISMNNDAIAKPFGTADTPLPGAIVSGTVPAFLWALTPDTDTVAGAGDIQIDPTGGTMFLFIDGVATAPVAYNQCRGNVGNPVPGGVFCNDDVANIFGNLTPQAPLTPRASNPTRFRNLDAARGAIGVNNIDTTLLSNGLHSIAWSVTDSAGRVEGIGSRVFTVLNGGSSLVARIMTLIEVVTAPAESRGAAASLDALPTSRRMMSVRTGFDVRTPFYDLPADQDGVRHVTVAPQGRLELALGGPAENGYLQVADELRDLPIGSALDRATGLFTWTPPSTYFGSYRLVFLIDGTRTTVEVRIETLK